MPARSEAQRRWAFANKGAAWARKHHFDNKGPLPKRRDERQRMVEGYVSRKRHG
jgi:hypothetical protein